MALPFLRRSNMPRLLASLLCCATLILISLVTLYWQTWSMTRQQAQTAAERAMTQIDSALQHSTLAAKAALPLASRPCREVARELRVLVATSPMCARSTSPATVPLLLLHLRRDRSQRPAAEQPARAAQAGGGHPART